MPETDIKLRIQTIDPGSLLWQQARRLRYEIFFLPHQLPPDILDDEQELSAVHFAAVAEQPNHGELLGYARLTDLGQRRKQLSQMVVPARYQRHGIGSRILTHIIEAARQCHARKLLLDARVDSLAFYQKLGFVMTGKPFKSPKTGVLHRKMIRHL